MAAAIEVSGLVKHYGNVKAVDGVDLTVEAGTVLGLLGPNGAGKTTIVRVLATLVRPDRGSARVCGFDVVREAHKVRQRIGLTGQYATVDEKLSGRENLYLLGRLFDLPARRARARADEMIERFDLVEAAGRLVSGYSGGMRRRLDVAASLVGEPRVLYLDEPTTGLDPRSRNTLWELVRKLAADGVTVLLTTQHMTEAEALASFLVVIDHGRIIATGATADLKQRVGGQVLRVRASGPDHLAGVIEALARAGLAATPDETDAAVAVAPLSGDDQLTAAVQALGASGVRVSDIETHLPSLDEVFLALTGPPEESASPAAAGVVAA